MDKPLRAYQYELPYKAVLLRCLDGNRQPIRNAMGSGFIRVENSRYYLYTCWHLVTGLDPHDLRVPHNPPNRRFLEVALQDAQVRRPGVTAIGGLQAFVVDLYDNANKPAWCQDEKDIPNADLNAVGIRVPSWHDAVKIALPEGIRVHRMQYVEDDGLFVSPVTLPYPGELAFVIGFPYGFSAVGEQQPTPVVLTRFIAATRIEDRQRALLLESIGAPGMSGGPVFLVRNNRTLLVGMYSGLIFPDHVARTNERTTALGTCVDMQLCWEHMALVPNAAES